MTPGAKLGDLTAITGEAKSGEKAVQKPPPSSSTARSSRSRRSSVDSAGRTDARSDAGSRARDAPIVEIRELSKYYVRGDQLIPVLVEINLDVWAGDYIALMGPSGSGKTTLLNLIAGIDKPTSGEIHVGGVDIAQLSEGELAAWRAAHVGFIFQFYNLMPVLSAFENVELPLLLTALVAPRAPRARRSRARRWSGLPTARTTTRTSCPAASSSAWRSRGR